MRRLEGDEAVYYMLNENGNLNGMITTHVEDFDLAGNSRFLKMVTKKVSQALDVLQVEDDHFRFTGIDVKKTEEEIEISRRIMQ